MAMVDNRNSEVKKTFWHASMIKVLPALR